MRSKRQQRQNQAVRSFLKVFSCAHSVIMTMAEHCGCAADINVLRAATGFAAGLSTAGDVCGTVNGSALALGAMVAARHRNAEDGWRTAVVCNEFFRRTQMAAGTCNCGEMHGGKHLTKNFRRSLLTGKTLKCLKILYEGAGIFTDLIDVIKEDKYFLNSDKSATIRNLYAEFESSNFHCCWSTLRKIGERSGLDVSPLDRSTGGFIGGIGFSGTLCGALVGGVLAIGLKHGVDPRESGYMDTVKIAYQGLLKSDGIFRDERILPAASTFNRCLTLYRMVEAQYGDCNCATISGLNINEDLSLERFRKRNGIETCRRLAETIAQEASRLLS